MSDIRTSLERMRGTLVPGPEHEALERLRQRKEHRFARRRAAAALTAVVITAASTTALIRAFDGQDERVSHPAPLPAVDPHVTATIRVGHRGQVSAITSGFGSVWVAAYGVPGGEGIDRDAILRIDPATNQVADTIPVETVPSWETGGGGLATGFGSLWVAGWEKLDGGQQGLLLRIDPTTLEVVSRIPIETLDGFGDVAINNSAVWVVGTRGDGSAVARVDPTTEQVTDQTSLRGQAARRVIATDGAVIVREQEWAGGGGPCPVLASVDPTDAHLIAEEPARGACTGNGDPFAWEGEAWVAGQDGFAKLDTSTLRALAPVTPYAITAGFPRSDVTVDATGVWFGAYPGGNGSSSDTLSRFDPASGRIDTFPMELGWSAATVLDGTLWAMDWEGTVTRIDLFGPASESGT